MRAYEAILKRAKTVWELSDYDKVTISSHGAEVAFRGDGPGFGVVPKSPGARGDAWVYLWPDTVDLIVEANEFARESWGERRRWLDLDDEDAVAKFVTAKNAEAVAGSWVTGPWITVPPGTHAKVVGGSIPGGDPLSAEQVVAILRAAGVMK